MYKFYTSKSGMPVRLYHKFLLFMRLTTILLIGSFLQVSASTLAQKITLARKNVKLETVLQEIRQQSGYDIFYNSRDIAPDQKVSVNITNADVEVALTTILKGLPLTFTIDGKIISIKKKEGSFLDDLKALVAAMDVHGRVVDETGKALPGVTVKVKDGSQATITSANGEFELKKLSDNAVLVLTFIGYAPKEVPANGDLANIRMEVSNSKLDEVQIQAYGKTSQRLSTGDITTIKAAEIKNQPNNNVLQAIEGRVPGLQIKQTSGAPGSGLFIQVRGQNSIASGNMPLYVIDGVPIVSQLPSALGGGVNNGGNPLDLLNIEDIESIDVLKDADALSIYGSRAANGAILITTKKGKLGKAALEASVNSGVSEASHFMKLMNTQQYLEMRNEALKNDGLTPGPTDYDINGTWDPNRYTDWQKVLLGNKAAYNDYQISLSGGSENTQFRIGSGYHREGYIFPGAFSYQKGSVSFAINNTSQDKKLNYSLTGNFVNEDNHLPGASPTNSALTLAPNAPSLYNADGSLNWDDSRWINPLSYTLYKVHSVRENLLASGFVSYQAGKELSLKISFGYNDVHTNGNNAIPTDYYPPAYNITTGSAFFNHSQVKNWIAEPQLNYNHLFSNSALNILVGGTLQKNSINQETIYAQGFTSNLLLQSITAATSLTPSSTQNSDYRYAAIFGRLNYSLAEKYIINLTIRRDGSSRFGPNNRFADFGSVGTAWIFSNEKFIKDNLSFISFGKLRLSYGTTGNDQIGDYSFLDTYYPTSGAPYQSTIGLLPSSLYNPNLQWEIDKKLEAGFQTGLIKDKILFSLSYFRNRSSNQLLGYTLPDITGFLSIQKNLPATVQNTGLETNLEIKWLQALQNAGLKWSTSINMTFPRNKLIKFDNLATSSYRYNYQIGKSIYNAVIYQVGGVDSQTGQYYYLDHNNQPTMSPSYLTDTHLIDLSPQYYGGVSNTFNYKGFELNVFVQFQKQVGRNMAVNYVPGFNNYNQPVDVLQRWQKPGDNTPYQKYFVNNAYGSYSVYSNSSLMISDASYLKLKNVSIGYTFNSSVTSQLHVRALKIFIEGKNLYTITKYKGFDPETQSGLSLPLLRFITGGLNVSF